MMFSRGFVAVALFLFLFSRGCLPFLMCVVVRPCFLCVRDVDFVVGVRCCLTFVVLGCLRCCFAIYNSLSVALLDVIGWWLSDSIFFVCFALLVDSDVLSSLFFCFDV